MNLFASKVTLWRSSRHAASLFECFSIQTPYQTLLSEVESSLTFWPRCQQPITSPGDPTPTRHSKLRGSADLPLHSVDVVTNKMDENNIFYMRIQIFNESYDTKCYRHTNLHNFSRP